MFFKLVANGLTALRCAANLSLLKHPYAFWVYWCRTQLCLPHGVAVMTLCCTQRGNAYEMLDWVIRQLHSSKHCGCLCFLLCCLVVKFGALMKYIKYYLKISHPLWIIRLRPLSHLSNYRLACPRQPPMHMYINCLGCQLSCLLCWAACRSFGTLYRQFNGPALSR